MEDHNKRIKQALTFFNFNITLFTLPHITLFSKMPKYFSDPYKPGNHNPNRKFKSCHRPQTPSIVDLNLEE